jgi:aspartyl-tRNA(Asn)/glutamyl-tRNA(Gln) amidotransferase subunit A
MWTVAGLQRELAEGRTTSRKLVEQALACIADPAGEGARAFLKVYAEQARAEAEHADRLRRQGVVRSGVEGLPVSVKDLFDVAGDVTRAGSKLLAGASPATQDAPAVARLRAAGAVIVGRTNMVEFAFGTTGLNPHYGTPRNPWDRKTGRVPGGSSSGAAVAQADGMCVMALGSDTRGSIRQPAALCGVTGWKPTQRRVPREGAFPLSYTLDTVGPLANSVACCAAYDAILSGEPAVPLALPVKGLRLLLPRSNVLDDLDPEVGRAFDAALGRLSAAGALIREERVEVFDRQPEYFKNGGFAGAEAYAIHRRWQDRLGEYDPRIAKRVLFGKEIGVADYIDLGLMRADYMRKVEALAAAYDAMLMPTTPTIAPAIAEVDRSDEDYFRWNFRILRNVGIVNFLDGCAVSVPCHETGAAPVGLSVFGVAMSDRHVLAAAHAIEGALRARA